MKDVCQIDIKGEIRVKKTLRVNFIAIFFQGLVTRLSESQSQLFETLG